MAEARKCKKCCQSIDSYADLFTVCEGDCAGLFHASCVGLKDEDIDFLTLSQNALWMCDTCMSMFRKTREGIPVNTADKTDSTKSIEQEVKDLKTAVNGILNTLSKIVPTATTSPNTPSNVLHSTPIAISSHTLFNGTNGCVASVSNCDSASRPQIEDEIRTNNDYFALFLSNINPYVSERDVHQMVSRALGFSEPERLDVTKLTKRWNDQMMPDFVSFKVIVSRKWKYRALDPSTWPVNVKFREFVCKHNDTWRP